MEALFAVVIALLLVIALLCWRLSRQHAVAAFHLATMGRMCVRLKETDPAYIVARDRREEAIRRGIWRTG